jgi:hypothetical protein
MITWKVTNYFSNGKNWQRTFLPTHFFLSFLLKNSVYMHMNLLVSVVSPRKIWIYIIFQRKLHIFIQNWTSFSIQIVTLWPTSSWSWLRTLVEDWRWFMNPQCCNFVSVFQNHIISIFRSMRMFLLKWKLIITLLSVFLPENDAQVKVHTPHVTSSFTSVYL